MRGDRGRVKLKRGHDSSSEQEDYTKVEGPIVETRKVRRQIRREKEPNGSCKGRTARVYA